MRTLLTIVFFYICYWLYEKWKDAHAEQIQAKKQAKLLESQLSVAKEDAVRYNCINNYYKNYDLLRNDLKGFIFSSDYGNPHKHGLTNWDNYPNLNNIIAIRFYHLCDMPSYEKSHGINKEEAMNYFIEADLLNSPFVSPECMRTSYLRDKGIK